MKVMPSVLGQVGNDIAGDLFEIGKSVVAGTAKAATGIVSETIEQVMSAPGQVTMQNAPKNEGGGVASGDEKMKMAEKQRYEQVKLELETYAERKRALDKKIAEEKAAESQQTKQKDVFEKKKRDSWVSRVINRSQTTTEKGRLSE